MTTHLIREPHILASRNDEPAAHVFGDLFATSRVRVLLALLPPLGAFYVQDLYWELLAPFAFFLLYPALFFSAWIGRLPGGALGTVISGLAGWWYFLDPRCSFDLDSTKSVVSLIVFTCVGLGMSLLQGKVQSSLARTQRALDHVGRLNRELDQRVHERTRQLEASHCTLQSSEARLASIIGSAMDGIVSIDGEHRVTMFNAAAEKMFGRASVDVVGRPLEMLLPSRYREGHTRDIQQFGKAKLGSRAMRSQRELVGLRSDDAEFPIEASISHTSEGGAQTFTVILRDISDRKRSGETAALLAAIVESSTDAIVGKDLSGVVTSWNAAASHLFGFEADEMLGQSVTKLIPPERAAEEARILARVGEGEQIAPFETERRRKDGSIVHVSVSISPIRDARGTVVGMSKVARDITGRLQTERSLHESEARFHQMFDGMLEGCMILDFAWRYLYVNESTLRMARLPRAALIGHTLMEVFPGIETTEMFGALERCMRQRQWERMENSFTYPDNDKAWFDLSIQPSPEGLFVLSIDITERKAAQAAVQQSEDRFQHVAESLPQLIWTTSANGAYEYIGRQWERYTGSTLERSASSQWSDCIHSDDLAQLTVDWAAAGRDGCDFRTEYRIRRHDGVYRWFDASATALRDDKGVIVKWFWSNMDIDVRKRGQSLELRTQKMEALGTLAGGIAHDFNNILFAILGNAQLAQLTLGPGVSAYENLAEIERASLRARDLVRRILAFSRQEEPARAVIFLRPVVEEAVKLLRATLPAIIELRARFDDSAATLADAGQVHQIIMNLATNAAHAIGDTTGVLEIHLDAVHVDRELALATPGLREAAYVRLSVTDSGCGMSERTLERIFDPFFTTKPVGQGTGLGLSVVDGIMKSHGGAITVYSAPGKGTAFKLYFLATDQGVTTIGAENEPVPAGRGRRVLYVDDDQALVCLAERALGLLGYVVTGCSDPRDALALFRTQPDAFDILVTDLSMRWMSGNELACEVRALRPSLPIILTSGYVRPEDEAQAALHGIATIVLKPNTVDGLGRALGNVLAQAAQHS